MPSFLRERRGLQSWPRLLVVAISTLTACGPIADQVDRTLNPVMVTRTTSAGADAKAVHAGMLVADTHADTLLWRRGIRTERVTHGHVDLARLVEGNIGLQVFAIPTRVPFEGKNDCITGDGFDPASILARINGWPEPTWISAYQRSLHQAGRFNDTIKANQSEPRLWKIASLGDLQAWRRARFAGGGPQRPGEIAVLLAMEGAHGLQAGPAGMDPFAALDELHRLGLRMVSPTHRFDNDFGGSSEGCARGALKDRGRRLIEEMIAKRMVIDVAHASTVTLHDIVAIAQQHNYPLLVSHSGFQPFLLSLKDRHGEVERANTFDDLKSIASVGGTLGIGLWPEAVGGATVAHAVGAILHAWQMLKPIEGHEPHSGGHKIVRASQHISLGSDWDGAVVSAIDAAQVAMVTEGLLKSQLLTREEIADIMGRNACRVIAQSLAGPSGRTRQSFAKDFQAAIDLCDGK